MIYFGGSQKSKATIIFNFINKAYFVYFVAIKQITNIIIGTSHFNRVFILLFYRCNRIFNNYLALNVYEFMNVF